MGPPGFVCGVDISEDMTAKAWGNMFILNMKNVKLFCSSADNIPLESSSVDVVASNGIYNLCPNKKKVMKEVYRVLKPGGRIVASEIVLKDSLPEGEVAGINDWFRCIGGALTEEDFLTMMKKTGFQKIAVLFKGRNARTGHPLALSPVIRGYKPL